MDEQIIPTKCKSSIKQYCPKKSYKWGYKVFSRCGASGMIYDFEIYTGKSSLALLKYLSVWIQSLGTIRPNRMMGAQHCILKEKDLKVLGRGAYD